MTTIKKSFGARAAAALVLPLALAWAGCSLGDELLKANNPAAVNEKDLNDPKMADVLVNSAIGELQQAYAGSFIWVGSMLTDEQVTGINWEDYARVNQRIVLYDEGPADDMFRNLSRFRAMADTTASLVRGMAQDPRTDIRLAKALAYAGYGYILLGEAMCGADISRGGKLADKLYTPDEITALALPPLNEALTVALASSDKDGPNVANLARVGLARANLQLGKKTEAMSYAQQVPASFVWWVAYSENSSREYDAMYGQTHGANRTLGVHPHFLYGPFGTQNQTGQTDPRIQYSPKWQTGHNAMTKLYTPFSPLPYSSYNGAVQAKGGVPAEFSRASDIKLASGLEALHDYYEAAGPTGTGPAGTTLDFVNARRAFGNQAAVTLSGTALMAELREQRGRDLYLGGFRLGDSRRWKKLEGLDLFPTGATVNAPPNGTWGDYGTATCFPVPIQEYNGNPSLPKP